jgi:hypothetical protein
VLVVTLAVLVLSAGLMVALGRAAMGHAARAREARDDLQRRWGVASCQAAVLPVAEQLLAAEEARRGEPVASVRVTVRLGRQSFELTVADEQAKANVNALLADGDVPTAEDRVRQALTGYGLANKVRLRPAPRPPARQPGSAAVATTSSGRLGGWRPITGLGQILDAVPPADWCRPPAGGRPGGQAGEAAADLLTCWGDGGVNVRRAPEAALRLALSPPLTAIEVGRLIELRDEQFYAKGRPPGAAASPRLPGGRDAGPANRSPVRRLVDAAGLTAVGGRLIPRLSDGSTCHSLWVVADDGRRRRHVLAVTDRSGTGPPRAYSFAW